MEFKMTNQSHIIPKLISVSEAMQMMGIRRTAFYAEAKKGNITLKRFGSKKTLVPIESVAHWIDSLPIVGGDNV
jgi:predicted DNA-binding transcriptional regulator AlpA